MSKQWSLNGISRVLVRCFFTFYGIKNCGVGFNILNLVIFISELLIFMHGFGDTVVCHPFSFPLKKKKKGLVHVIGFATYYRINLFFFSFFFFSILGLGTVYV